MDAHDASGPAAPDPGIPPFTPLEALEVDLPHVTVVPGGDDGPGTTTAYLDVAAYREASIGIWQMSVGTMRDLEASEVFVVLSGDATVELLDGDDVLSTIGLAPGTLCRLEAGMSTRWTVTSTLRKLYVTGEPA